MQSNTFLSGNEILVLGHVNVDDLQASAQADGSTETLRRLVEVLDTRVQAVVRLIVAAGKFPIIIGGGHNNVSYSLPIRPQLH